MDFLPHLLVFLGVGVAGGFIAGLLGVGGGMIFVPVLFYVFTSMGAGEAMHAATGTSIALVAVTSLMSSYFHNRRGAVDFALLKRWAPAIIAGVAAGTLLSSSVDGATLKRVFAVAMLALSIYMGVSGDRGEPEDDNAGPTRISAPLQYAGAGGIGGLSSLLGIGGGSLAVPMMVYAGLPVRRAVGTGSAVGAVIAVPAVVGHMLSGYGAVGAPPYSIGFVNLAAALMVLPGCLLFSPLGVKASHALPRALLKRIFAGVLVIVSLKMFFS